MTVVYLDRVLLLNLLVDYLLLLTTARLAGIPPCGGEGWLCAPLSGRCTPVRCFCRGLSWLSHPLCRTAVGSRHGAGGVAAGGPSVAADGAVFFCWPEDWAA